MPLERLFFGLLDFIGVLWLPQTYLASTDVAWRPARLKQGTLATP